MPTTVKAACPPWLDRQKTSTTNTDRPGKPPKTGKNERQETDAENESTQVTNNLIIRLIQNVFYSKANNLIFVYF